LQKLETLKDLLEKTCKTVEAKRKLEAKKRRKRPHPARNEGDQKIEIEETKNCKSFNFFKASAVSM
jgi:hypothetical protein